MPHHRRLRVCVWLVTHVEHLACHKVFSQLVFSLVMPHYALFSIVLTNFVKSMVNKLFVICFITFDKNVW
jgi:hypothetical protein